MIRSLPITNYKENAWKNTVVSGINARSVIAGNGINVRYGPHGTILDAVIPESIYPVTYAGDYSFNSEYYPNTLVRVIETEELFLNQDYEEIPFGEREDDQLPFDVLPSETIIPMATGLFICVAYVPPAAWDETLIRPQYNGGVVPFSVVNSTRFYDFNVYYPVSPEIPEDDQESVISANGFAVVSNQTYWRFLGGGGGNGDGCLCRYS